MKAKVIQYTIEEFYKIRNKILDQPKYQRGKVWSPLKNKLLIDSILRGIDLPKIYLRKKPHGIFEYEIADGQQRIHAIDLFMKDKLILGESIYKGLDMSKIDRFIVGGKKKSEINEKLQKRFEDYKLTVAIIEEASNSEIRTLFGRLQMGDPLNPAEIRNAIISKIGDQIDLFVREHDFFKESKIKEERFKKQDYLTHCFAIVHYGNKYDLKAQLLQRLYYDLGSEVNDKYIDSVFATLNELRNIDKLSKRKIINKWTFFDLFYLIWQNIDKIESIDYENFARIFDDFERKRISTKKPEILIQGKKPDKDSINLYQYIMAFKTNGGNPKNIEIRNAVFKENFEEPIKYK